MNDECAKQGLGFSKATQLLSAEEAIFSFCSHSLFFSSELLCFHEQTQSSFFSEYSHTLFLVH